MPDVRGARGARGDPSDGDRDAPSQDLVEERRCRFDLVAPRRAVRALRSRMRRHDVPQQDVLFDAEPGKDAVNDGRARLRRAGARDLSLGRERQPAHTRPAVAGRLADEDDLRVGSCLEIEAKPITPED